MRWLLFVIAVAVGSLLPLQAGINATLRTHLEHPLRAASFNFLVGLTVLVAALLVSGNASLPSGAFRSAPPWAFFGGLIGATVVLGSLVIAPKLGGALLFAAIVAGQLSSGLLIDHFGLVGYPRSPITLGRIGGVLLVFAGVVLIQRS